MIKFDRNQPFNQLPDLPIDDAIIDKEVLLKWGTATRALAELNRNLLRLPNPLMLINTITLQEARSSTEIENIFTTDDELYRAISDTVREENANISTKEVLRYREALWHGYNELSKSKKMQSKIAISIFRKVKNTREGIRSPQSMVVIRRGNSEFRPGEVIYTPPRGAKIIEKKMDNLFAYLNNENQIDPLLKMAVAHYQFEAIHPFSDGNGRTGRILNLLYLVHQKLLFQPVLYLSKYILEHKDEYYYHLSGVTKRKAWKPWIIFMMEAVETTAKETNFKIDEILAQMESTYRHVNPKLKWYSMELNLTLFSQPYVKQKLIGEVIGVTSRTTLTKYMQLLEKHGVLSSRTEGREVYYLNNDLIRIIQS